MRQDEMGHDGDTALISRTPPHNLEAERVTIGSCMLDNAVIDEIASFLEPGDFWRSTHEEIFRAVLAVRDQCEPVDAVSVAEYLERQGRFGAIGGNDRLSEILNATPHAANGVYCARLVREKSLVRQLIQVSTETIAEAYSREHTASVLIERAERRVFGITDRQVIGSTADANQVISESMRLIGLRKAGESQGLRTGFSDLDCVLDGFKPGELTILAARPSQGKTALAMGIASKIAMDQCQTVLVISLEMNAVSLGERLLSAWSGVNGDTLRQSWRMTEKQNQSLHIAADGLSTAPIRIDDSPNRTVSQIAANARRVKSKDGLALVVIDYLSLIDGQRQKGENRQEEVARISRRLKAMARELHVPVLCLSQLNRQSETREDRRPRLADLRESGQIEQDADVVLLLHRPEYYDPNDQPGIAEVIVAKNRNGATATVRLSFAKSCTRFDSLVEHVPDDRKPY